MHKTFCTSAGCWSRPAAQTTPSSTSISPRQPGQTASKRAATWPPAVLNSREGIKNISPDLQGVGHADLWDTLPHRTPCPAGGTP